MKKQFTYKGITVTYTESNEHKQSCYNYVGIDEHGDEILKGFTMVKPSQHEAEELIRWHELHEEHRKLVQNTPFTAASFYIEGIEEDGSDTTIIYNGYHRATEYWNGWQCPCFEKDVFTKWLTDMELPYIMDGGTFVVTTIDPAEIVTTAPEDSDFEERAVPFFITVNDEQIIVYELSGYIWSLSEQVN